MLALHKRQISDLEKEVGKALNSKCKKAPSYGQSVHNVLPKAMYCFICGRRRVGVARYRMICLVLPDSSINLKRKDKYPIFQFLHCGIYQTKKDDKTWELRSNNLGTSCRIVFTDHRPIFIRITSVTWVALWLTRRWGLYDKIYRNLIRGNSVLILVPSDYLSGFPLSPWTRARVQIARSMAFS